jgi:DNA replication protein DnaC
LKLIKDEFFRVQKAFILDDTNKEKIAFCFNWVIGNIDQSLNKGLLLKGDVGTGKSCIMKAVKNFIKILYPGTFMMYLSADQITHVYRMTGDDFERNLNQIFTCRILFIDDIGYESLLEFGHMPIAEVIRERYDKKRITCITTNMNMEEIEDRYKKSFTDKLGEMCFIINFQGESKR